MTGTALDVLRCKCGLPLVTQGGGVYCAHCDTACKIGRSCGHCRAQQRSIRE